MAPFWWLFPFWLLCPWFIFCCPVLTGGFCRLEPGSVQPKDYYLYLLFLGLHLAWKWISLVQLWGSCEWLIIQQTWFCFCRHGFPRTLGKWWIHPPNMSNIWHFTREYYFSMTLFQGGFFWFPVNIVTFLELHCCLSYYILTGLAFLNVFFLKKLSKETLAVSTLIQ